MRISHQAHDVFSVLNIASFRNLWLSQVITQTGVNMLTFVLGLVVYTQAQSNSAVSLLYLSVGAPAAIFGVFSGVVVDRLNKKKLLLVSIILRIILIVLLSQVKTQLALIYFFAALISIVSQIFVPAEAALIPVYVPKDLLLSANSFFTMTFYSAIVTGFVAGGPLLEHFGEKGVMIILLFLFLISGLFLSALPKVTSSKSQNPVERVLGHLRQDLAMGFHYIKDTKIVTKALVVLTLAQAVIALMAILAPGLADRILTIKLTDASVAILAPAALGMIVGAFAVGAYGYRFRKLTLITSGVLISGFLFLILSTVILVTLPTSSAVLTQLVAVSKIKTLLLPLSIMSFFLLGFANSMVDVSCNAVLQQYTPVHIRGKVYGVLASIIAGVAILPVVLGGIIADFIGIGKLIFGVGLVIIAIGLYAKKHI